MRKPKQSTAPMDCINDAQCLIDHARGIADLLTAIEIEALCDGTIHQIGYAIDGILERVADRLSAASLPRAVKRNKASRSSNALDGIEAEQEAEHG